MSDNHNYTTLRRRMDNIFIRIQYQNMPIETTPVSLPETTSISPLQRIRGYRINRTNDGMYNIAIDLTSVDGLYDRSLSNPSLIGASEYYGALFDTIDSVDDAFNSFDALVLSIYNTIQTFFSLILNYSNLIIRLRPFMVKLRSFAKVVRWFLMKMIYLLNIVKRSSRSNSEENSGSSNNGNSGIVPIGTQDEEIHSVEGHD